MYQRARAGIGYLAQEPSIFRKMTVEENILAILETRGLGRDERHQRLDRMLDELSIKHLRRSKAYSLSGGERRRLEITRALVSEPKFMLLDEPFAGVDPIAVHDIQTIVAGLRHRGIGVLITDHNVEQTLDIVDRAYIMFEGKVQASGRCVIWSTTTASPSSIWVPPSPRASGRASRRWHEDRALAAHQPAPGAAGQSAALPGDGHAVHAHDGPAAASEAGAALQPLPRAARARGGDAGAEGRGAGEGAEGEGRGDGLGGDPPQRLRGRRHPRTVRAAGVHRAGDGRDQGPDRPPARAAPDAHAEPAAAPARRGVPRQHQRGGLSRRVAGGDPRLGQPAGGRRMSRSEAGRRARRAREDLESPTQERPSPTAAAAGRAALATLLLDGRDRGDGGDHPEARPARASARATCGSAS